MRKSFKVVLDCDDVLYQCNEESVKKLNKEKGYNFKLSDIHDWGYLGDELDERLHFFSDPDFMGNLPLYDGAKEFVNKLSKKAEIFVCTNVEPLVAGIRIQSVIKDFPEINPANIIIGKRKDLLKADMMLDDNIYNLEKAESSFPVLMRRPWNYNQTGVLSITNYDEFLALVDIVKNNQAKDEPYQAIVLVGPSGSGKNIIADKLTANPKFERVKSFSTKNHNNYNSIDFYEFYNMLSDGEFFETSFYSGDAFGTRKKDIIKIIEAGKTPVLVMDINGAIALKNEFNSLNVFINIGKEQCIRHILDKQYSKEETIHRILSIDAELKNEDLCDITLIDNNINRILEEIA